MLVVSPLEQQVERLNANGVKSALPKDMTSEDLKYVEIEISFGSVTHWISEKWRESLKSTTSRTFDS